MQDGSISTNGRKNEEGLEIMEYGEDDDGRRRDEQKAENRTGQDRVKTEDDRGDRQQKKHSGRRATAMHDDQHRHHGRRSHAVR